LHGETAGAYELILTPPARRALTERLSEAVAAAVVNFLTTSLVREPQRVGKPLWVSSPASGPRAAAHIASCCGCARIEVIVVRIEHRREAYRLL
jgi:mRNA-degrading endonuclease RelE of RelBE toxin-antitoxin system